MIFQKIIEWQLGHLNDVLGWLVYGGIAVLGLLAIGIFYKIKGNEFIELDGKFSEFEKRFVKHAVLKYFLWGLLQQVIIIAIVRPLMILGLHPTGTCILALVLFSTGYHFPNVPLILLTACMGAALYIPFFVFDFQNILAIGLVHGILGTAVYLTGMNMAVWVNHENFNEVKKWIQKLKK